MKVLNLYITLILVFFIFSCTSEQVLDTNLKLNQIQLIGTHNSYKKAIDPAIMQEIIKIDNELAQSLDYAHRSLTEQLDFGARKLEIDVFHDPEGGKYSHPMGIGLQLNAGIEALPIDTSIMDQPGFKVLHVQDIDFRSNCTTLRLCLEEILAWSNQHPNHIPLFISFNAKSEAYSFQPKLVEPLPFTSEVFDAMEAEISAIIPRSKIIKPDDIRRTASTLEEAILTKGWLPLEDTKGKFVFVLDATTAQRDAYKKDHPSLKKRLMFLAAEAGTPEAAIIFKNDPIRDQKEIQELVSKGYIVRTRADSETIQARKNDYSRFEAAKKSGAQIISTDYLWSDNRFKTDYQVKFSNNNLVRSNPIIGKKE